MTTQWTTETKGVGAYADVNGINLYYETHGAGCPLLLLHGGLGSGARPISIGPSSITLKADDMR